MHMHNLATAAITSAFLLLGSFTAATAAPAGILAVGAATNPAAAHSNVVKVRRGYHRGRYRFGHRRFRFRSHRGGFGRYYGFKRRRFYRRPHYGYRRHYYRYGYGRRFYY